MKRVVVWLRSGEKIHFNSPAAYINVAYHGAFLMVEEKSDSQITVRTFPVDDVARLEQEF